MLFHLTLRDAFLSLPATPLDGPALRRERARIEALAPAKREVTDWLSLAETALSLDGREAAAAALAEARRHRLDGSLSARADLVEALLIAAARRWGEAASLFARAERGLDPRRRVSAVYGRYVAASLADPSRAQRAPELRAGDPTAALAHAFVTGFREDLAAAAAELELAGKRFPGDARIAAFSAQLALALDRRETMRRALDRARAIDPQDPEVLYASAMGRAQVEGDIKRALAELKQAADVAPGQAQIWNGIGLLESARDAPIEAEAAFRRAIAADPQDPVAYANLAIQLLEESRVAEAGTLIDKAMSLDPAFHAGLTARARYLMQKGDMAGAIEAALAGSAANPAYSQGLLTTAIAYYQNGDVALAEQALDNADRLDPNDAIVSIVRTAIAIDQYRADEAVLSAREALRRARARGGDQEGIAVNRQSGSYPVAAYRFINLNEWARFYGDRTFDPFAASSYFDEASIARPSLLLNVKPSLSTVETGADADLATFNLLVQGLLFDPLAVSGRIGRIDLLRRPFLDLEIGGGLTGKGGELGWQTDATVQGYSNAPVPTSFSLAASRLRAKGRLSIDDESADSAAFFVGAAPSASDRFLLYGTAAELAPGPIAVSAPDRATFDAQRTTAAQAGGGWSHSFGDRNVLTAAFYGTRGDTRRYNRRSAFGLAGFTLLDLIEERKERIDGGALALNHSVGFGDLTIRYGAEAQSGDAKSSVVLRLPTQDLATRDSLTFDAVDRTAGDFTGGRLYGDVLWRLSDRFEMQAGLQGTRVDLEAQRAQSWLGPRAGVAFSPIEGQWLRAAYRSDAVLPLPFTLSPVATIGLVPDMWPISLGGRVDTAVLRWDAEWTPRVFTAVEYQHQDLRDLDLPVAVTFDTLAIDRARIERVAASANLWLGDGVGMFATLGATASEIRSGAGLGEAVPLVPGRFARAGFTFVHESRLRLTIAQSYFGDLTGNANGLPLKDYWTTDAAISWETPDRRLLFELTALNLFDAASERAPLVPGPGRTVAATIKARF